MATDLYAALEQAIPAVREEFETLLRDLVQIPTVSMDPAHASDIQQGAHQAAAILQACGATVEVVETPGNPVVFGQFTVNPAYPTVAIYNHLDVQPANEPQWRGIPLCFQRDGEFILDVAPPMIRPTPALLAARFAVQHSVPLNVQFLWELEEEIGSPHFADFVAQRRQALTCNSVVVSDTVWLSRTTPAVPYGLRGMLTMLLRLETGSNDCHSGLTGGAARNPIGELSDLITRCYDAHRPCPHAGFYDVRPRVPRTRQFLSVWFNLATFMAVHGLAPCT
jgi:acetylornithine deacetylase/succinyl-diaminopimelate desuccinylase-like protein